MELKLATKIYRYNSYHFVYLIPLINLNCDETWQIGGYVNIRGI